MNENDSGRVGYAETGSREPDPSCTGSGPSGFDPARCRVCGGDGWVCENHIDRPWGGICARDDACECGAGAPCAVCNSEMANAPLIYALAETREFLEMAVSYMESVAADMNGDPPWCPWTMDGDGLGGFRAVILKAIAMEARQGGDVQQAPSASADDSAGRKASPKPTQEP